jgi:hypothetical protein
VNATKYSLYLKPDDPNSPGAGYGNLIQNNITTGSADFTVPSAGKYVATLEAINNNGSADRTAEFEVTSATGTAPSTPTMAPFTSEPPGGLGMFGF